MSPQHTEFLITFLFGWSFIGLIISITILPNFWERSILQNIIAALICGPLVWVCSISVLIVYWGHELLIKIWDWEYNFVRKFWDWAGTIGRC